MRWCIFCFCTGYYGLMSNEEKNEIVLQGVAASPGVSHGPAFVYLQKELEVPVYQIREDDQPAEVERFERALVTTRQQISKIREEVAQKLGEEEAQIFDAHLLVLEDRALIEETIAEQAESGYNIEYAFRAVSHRYIEVFDAMDDPYLKERVTDLRDVSRRVLQNMLGKSGGMGALKGRQVLVSEDLSPSDTAGLDKGKVLAVVTDAGSRTSHAVIMARSLQVPAVVGLHDATAKIENKDYLLVDGYDGVIVINPSEQTLYRYGQFTEKRRHLQHIFEETRGLPTVTHDGKAVHLMANVGGEADLPGVLENKPDGVGLFRTEGIFLAQDGIPSEEVQYQEYKKVAAALSPEPVIIRTLDMGGDKRNSSFMFAEKEENPFMGFRAIRFCLEHREVFKDQLRAILRASNDGNVRIMYPMISSLFELVQANAVLEEAKQELRERGQPFNEAIEVGSMIEIPSAAQTADLLADHCSFFSVGTNDLIQYLLAVDRVNDRIAHLYEPTHPAVLRTLRDLIKTAHERGLTVGICGEMAADPIYVPLLLGLGADDLSASAGVLSEIKYLIRKIKMSEARALAESALSLSDPRAIFRLLKDFYDTQLGEIVQRAQAENSELQ